MMATRYDDLFPRRLKKQIRHVLFAFPVDATRLSVSSSGGKNRRDLCLSRHRFKYVITSEIDGCIQSRFRVYHLLEAVKKSRVPACSVVRRSQRAEACHDRRSRVFHTANVGSRWRLSESPRSCRCAPERTSPPRRLHRARRVSSSHPNFFPRALEEGSTPKKMPDGAPARSLAPSTRPDRARASRPTLTVPTSPIHELPHRRISRRIPPPRAARVRGRTMTSSTGTPPSSGPLTRPTRAASSSWPST